MKKQIVRWLIDKNCIVEEDAELYEYALGNILFSVLPFLGGIVEGIIMGDVLSSLFIILSFVTIRRSSGGFHSKSSVVCLISSTIIMIASYFVPRLVSRPLIIVYITIIAGGVIALLSPVENRIKPLMEYEKRRNKKKAIVLVSVWISVEIFLYWIDCKTYCVNIATGILLVMCMQLLCIPEIIKNRRRDKL